MIEWFYKVYQEMYGLEYLKKTTWTNTVENKQVI